MYELKEVTLSPYHPVDPGKSVWSICNNKTKQFNMSYYYSQRAGLEMLKRKLEGEIRGKRASVVIADDHHEWPE